MNRMAFNLLGLGLLNASSNPKFHLKKIIIKVYLIYNVILVSGAQHNDFTILYITYVMLTALSVVAICHHTKLLKRGKSEGETHHERLWTPGN